MKERADKGDVKVEYCHTKLMLADFYTKPLQEQLFRKFRDTTIGYKPLSSLKEK